MEYTILILLLPLASFLVLGLAFFLLWLWFLVQWPVFICSLHGNHIRIVDLFPLLRMFFRMIFTDQSCIGLPDDLFIFGRRNS